MELHEYMRELYLMERQFGQEEELYLLINILLRESKSMNALSVRRIACARRDAAKFPGRKLLYGYGAFPDIAILDEKFDATKELDKKKNEMYGCVEAKKLSKVLLDIEGTITIKDGEIEGKEYSLLKVSGKLSEAGELLSELLWYGKVLYTNGLIWKYLTVAGCEPDLKNLREELYDKCVARPKKECKKWYEEVKNLKNPEKGLEITISCKEIANLTEIYNKVRPNNKPIPNDKPIPVKSDFSGTDYEEWQKLKDGLAEITWKESTPTK